MPDSQPPTTSSHGHPLLSNNNSSPQAIISVVQARSGDGLRCVHAGGRLLVFLERGPLYLVGVSDGAEGEAAAALQLDLLHRQLLMLLTSAFERPFARNPSYDVRSLLGARLACVSPLSTSIHVCTAHK